MTQLKNHTTIAIAGPDEAHAGVVLEPATDSAAEKGFIGQVATVSLSDFVPGSMADLFADIHGAKHAAAGYVSGVAGVAAVVPPAVSTLSLHGFGAAVLGTSDTHDAKLTPVAASGLERFL